MFPETILPEFRSAMASAALKFSKQKEKNKKIMNQIKYLEMENEAKTKNLDKIYMIQHLTCKKLSENEKKQKMIENLTKKSLCQLDDKQTILFNNQYEIVENLEKIENKVDNNTKNIMMLKFQNKRNERRINRQEEKINELRKEIEFLKKKRTEKPLKKTTLLEKHIIMKKKIVEEKKQEPEVINLSDDE